MCLCGIKMQSHLRKITLVSVSGWLQKTVGYMVHQTQKNKSFFYKLKKGKIQRQRGFSGMLWKKNTNCTLKALAYIWKKNLHSLRGWCSTTTGHPGRRWMLYAWCFQGLLKQRYSWVDVVLTTVVFSVPSCCWHEAAECHLLRSLPNTISVVL